MLLKVICLFESVMSLYLYFGIASIEDPPEPELQRYTLSNNKEARILQFADDTTIITNILLSNHTSKHLY